VRTKALLFCGVLALFIIRVYFPWLPVDGGRPNAGRGTLPPIVRPAPAEAEIIRHMQDHPDQGRPTLIVHGTLMQVAEAHAADMAERGYFDHINPDGVNANGRVIDAGYALPYPRDANNIESIAGGYATAQAAWDAWMDSDAHRAHLLAEDDFFAAQIYVGVGYVYVEGSEYGHYWVVVTAP